MITATAQKFSDITDELDQKFYTTFHENRLNLDLAKRKAFVDEYYLNLEADKKDVHANRDRARDVFEYSRTGGGIHFNSAKDIKLVDKNYEGVREYKRLPLINDLFCNSLARDFLSLIPKIDQKPHGLLGLNLFRTYDVVTQTRH